MAGHVSWPAEPATGRGEIAPPGWDGPMLPAPAAACYCRRSLPLTGGGTRQATDDIDLEKHEDH